MLIPKIYPVTCHTDHVGENSTFVAITGFQSDGAIYIEDAIHLGATKIVIEDASLLEALRHKHPDVNFFCVKDARKELASLSAKKLNNPASKLKIIGITGTKGKTTTAFLVEHILTKAGFKTALLGTIKNKMLNEEEPASLTTLSADTLQMFFKKCVEEGVTHVVMEVSSHALSLDRAHGIEFEVGCFTNLGQDHLDFYSSMENYFESKKKLFNQLKPYGKAIINTDDEWGARIAKDVSDICPVMLPKILKNSLEGLTFLLDDVEITCPAIFGGFNAYNMAMAYSVARSLGVKTEVVQEALLCFSGVPGRLQPYKLKAGGVAFVDFAHNPSSMEAVLAVLREMTKHLIVLFGCGGDRDKTKRPLMGEVAARYGNIVVVTSDNPRFEDGDAIIKEVLTGEGLQKAVVEPDRKKAIAIAAGLAKSGSVVAILGKGHERYNLIKGKKYHFDDFEEISKF